MAIQEVDSGHDLTGLAVAALGHVEFHPGLLQGVNLTCACQALDVSETGS